MEPKRLLFSFFGMGFLLLLSVPGCASSHSSLTEEQMDKLTPPLQRVVRGEKVQSPMGPPTATTSDGTTVYLVILRTDDADAVREAGIPLNSVQGSRATARLTVEQIRRAAALESVSRIEPSGRSQPM